MKYVLSQKTNRKVPAGNCNILDFLNLDLNHLNQSHQITNNSETDTRHSVLDGVLSVFALQYAYGILP